MRAYWDDRAIGRALQRIHAFDEFDVHVLADGDEHPVRILRAGHAIVQLRRKSPLLVEHGKTLLELDSLDAVVADES